MTSTYYALPHTFASHTYMDRGYTRDSNSAGAPLPRIPRRTPPSSRVHSAATSPSNGCTASTSTSLQSLFNVVASPSVVVQPATPPSQSPSDKSSQPLDEPSSSSSGTESHVEINTKSRRQVPPHMDLRRPEHSTPTPAVFNAKSKSEARISWPLRKDSDNESDMVRPDDTPRPAFAQRAAAASKTPFRLDLDALKVSSPSPTKGEVRDVASAPASASRTVSASGPLIRKKSGEPLKSSLKSRSPSVRGDLSVITNASIASKSEPGTPTSVKSVHFDSQLEHVKLFLAEQKPAAVSRDGSPTDDTSGTESDFPSFIYGGGPGPSEEELIRKSLALDVINLPPIISPDADVALESLMLSEDGGSINGRVRVKNIAFEKWVAVRFTFDWWQTTSEVTAKYVESLPGGQFDRFAFAIRLNDMLKRIEQKTLFLAVRYSVVGQEMWDNNSGQNYQVKFKRKAPAPQLPIQKPAEAAASSSPGESRMADLKNKLEQVAQKRETVGGFLSPQPRPIQTPSPSPSPDSFSLKSGVPLSSRYDFTASLKSPWRAGSPSGLGEERPRTNTYPNSTPHFPRRSFLNNKKAMTATPIASRGSPRMFDSGENTPEPFYAGSDSEETPVPQAVMSRRNKARNHQRGYFNLGLENSTGATIRRTPPTSPGSESPFRYNSFPPTNGTATVASPGRRTLSPQPSRGASALLSPSWGVLNGGSAESTPSTMSNDTSTQSSLTSSPLASPVDGPMLGADSPPGASNGYNVFLDKFCFYTGSDSLLDVPIDSIQRSHSASSVEELLSSPHTTGSYHLSPGHTPTRSSSFDDVSIVSGNTTPTMSFHPASTTPPLAPVAFVH
ncbi:hypothetical protein K474DRAFT_1340251 [Panus rudis PR-1116 ss-1]|nr:hypothetical protein K474DRAFT_1340251 [Panus rudis PR-1116 ss-1]